jgi:hypothetical protein
MTAILRAAEAIALAAVTRQYQTGSQQLTVALLGTCAVLTLAAAVGAVCGAARSAVFEWRQRRAAAADPYTPPDYPLWPYGKPDPATAAREVRAINDAADPYAEVARHAWRETWTPATLPLPALDETAVMAAVGGGR